MKPGFLLLLLLPAITMAQIPRNAKVIVVKGVTFSQVCEQLLDKGYTIEKKDNDLQTVRTEPAKYPKHWNAAYQISIRVRDTAAYITATFTSPFDKPSKEPLYNNEPVYYHTNRNGEPHLKSLPGYAFSLVHGFALSFGKPVEYSL